MENERPNGPISCEARFSSCEMPRRNVLNPGTQLPRRILFPERKREARHLAEPRSRYDTVVYGVALLSPALQRNPVSLITRLFLTAREIPICPGEAEKFPGNKPGKPRRTAAGSSAASLHYETRRHFRITRGRDAKRRVETSRSVINSRSAYRKMQTLSRDRTADDRFLLNPPR